MNNNQNEEAFGIQKDQLLPEKAFIEHCLYDYHRNRKLEYLDQEFIRAAELDGFLEPLLQTDEDVIQKDGSRKKELISYYSPHQLCIIASLSSNLVYGGLLWTHQDTDFYKEKQMRFVEWGLTGYAFNVEYVKSKKNASELNIFDYCKDFHNFLKLVHSLDNNNYSNEFMQRERHFRAAPSIHFDYSPLKNNQKLLKTFKLSVKQLRMLLKNTASIATQIDPLEHWYYYIHRHPQWRKDLFKGKALLAQEIYIICDLLAEVIEVVTGERQQPLFEMLYSEKNFHPYLIPRIEYVHGTDVKSMWAAIHNFKDWLKKDENSEFVDKTTLSNLDIFGSELEDYEKRYGAKSFISNGTREVEVEEKLKIEDLDPKTRRYVNEMIKQSKEQLASSKHQFLSLWDDELMEKVKNKEITFEEAKKEDYDLFVKREIFDAIEQRLSGLRRELWTIFDAVRQNIARKVNEAWQIEHDFGNYFWSRNKEKLNKLSRDKQHEIYEIEYKKVSKNAQYWSKKRDDYNNTVFVIELLFCTKCRQQPVQIHYDHSDSQLSTHNLCDDCFSKIESGVLDMTLDDWKQVNEGWQCDCYVTLKDGTQIHPTLYKFANRNTVSLWSKTSVPIKVELNYGKATLEAKCPNCGRVQQKELDWGWLA